MNRLLRMLALCIVVCLGVAVPALAVDYCWNLPTGSDYADNASLYYDINGVNGIVPGAGDRAILKSPGVMLYDATHAPWATTGPDRIYVGDGLGTYYCPDPSEGHIQQTGGVLKFKDYVIVGYNESPGTSTYELTGGTLEQTGTGGQLRVGSYAAGSMTVTDSTLDLHRMYNAYGLGRETAGIMTMSGATSMTVNRVILAHGCSDRHQLGNAVSTLDLYDTSSITAGDNVTVAIWNGSHSTLSLHDSSKLTLASGKDLYVGDANPSTAIDPTEGIGIVNISDNAEVTVDEVRLGNLSMGVGTLNIGSTTGTAKLTASNVIRVGIDGGQGTLNVSDGAEIVQTYNEFQVGKEESVGRRSVGVVNMDGGLIDRRTAADKRIIIGLYADGTWNHNGGTLLNNDAGILLGRPQLGSTGNATINLNGGIFETGHIRNEQQRGCAPGTSLVNLNGGTLRATAGGLTMYNGGPTQVMQTVVGAGGAIIDTNGFDLQACTGLTDGGGGGGMTKQGAGTLMIRGASTYTGATNVTAGGLVIGGLGSLATSDITIGDNAMLGLPSAAAVTGPLNTLSLGSGSTVDLALTATGGTTADTITTGTLDLPGAVTLRVGAQGGAIDTTTPYTIVSQGALTGAGTINAVSLIRGTTAVATVNPNNVTVAISGTAAAANLEWSGVGTVWDTIGASNWTNLAGPLPDQFYELDTVTLNDNGANNPVIEVVGRVHPGAIVESGATDYTLSGMGEVAGQTTTLTKSGTGTLTLDNSGGVTIGGAVTISAGVLRAGSNGGDNTLSGPVSLSGGAVLDAANYGTLRLTGVVSDDGTTGVTKTGDGAVVLANAANTYTGVTNVHGGVLTVTTLADGGVASSIGASSASAANLRFNNTGTLQYIGPDVTIDRGFGLDGHGYIYTDNNLTMTGGVDTTAGQLNKTGAGTLTLISSGFNQVGDRLLVRQGEVVFDGPTGTEFKVSGRIYVANDTGMDGALTVRGDALLTITDDLYMADDGADAALTIADNAKVVVTDHVFMGQEGGDGVITMSGNALLDIKDNTRIGGQNQGATPGLVTITLTDKARIQTNSYLNVGERFYDTNVSLSKEASFHSNANIDFGYGRKSNCTVVMNDDAKATANSGIYIGVNGDFAAAHITLNQRASMSTTRMNIGSNGGSYGDATATVVLNDDATITCTDALAIGNDDAAHGTLIMNDDSVVTVTNWLSVGNVYDGGNGHGSGEAFLSDNARMVVIDHLEVAYGGIGIVRIGDGTLTDNAVVSSQTNAIVLGWGTGGMDTEARIDINGGGTLEATGIITGNDGAGLEPLSSVVNFDGGTLRALADNADFITNAGGAAVQEMNILAGGATIDTNAHDIAISLGLTPVGTDGGLTKVGDGRLTLAGASTYAGDTTVVAGELAVTGSLTSDVCVNAGAALLGTGHIAGDIIVAGTGSVGPGTSIGTLTVDGDATICGTFDVEYDSDSKTIDMLAVSGTIDLTGATISFSDIGAGELDPGVYVFATYGALAGAPATEVGLGTNWWVDYDYNGNSIALMVPEPGTFAMLLGMIAALAAWRKRR